MAEKSGTERSGSSKAIPGLLQGRRSQAPHPCRPPEPPTISFGGTSIAMNLSPVKSYSALLITGISLTLFCLLPFIPRTAPRFILNSSSSLPRGLYIRAEKQAITSGSIILFPAPTNARSYVYGRGWLPEGWPLMKTVAGLPGDIYCLTDEQIVVNHRSFGPVFPRQTGSSRFSSQLPRWQSWEAANPLEAFFL